MALITEGPFMDAGGHVHRAPLKRKPSAEDRKRRWEEERRDLAERLGFTPEQMEDLLKTLPYSTIPDWQSVEDVVNWFRDNGWEAKS